MLPFLTVGGVQGEEITHWVCARESILEIPAADWLPAWSVWTRTFTPGSTCSLGNSTTEVLRTSRLSGCEEQFRRCKSYSCGRGSGTRAGMENIFLKAIVVIKGKELMIR